MECLRLKWGVPSVLNKQLEGAVLDFCKEKVHRPKESAKNALYCIFESILLRGGEIWLLILKFGGNLKRKKKSG